MRKSKCSSIRQLGPPLTAFLDSKTSCYVETEEGEDSLARILAQMDYRVKRLEWEAKE